MEEKQENKTAVSEEVMCACVCKCISDSFLNRVGGRGYHLAEGWKNNKIGDVVLLWCADAEAAEYAAIELKKEKKRRKEI